jgi:hypothetical protein
MQGHQTLPIPQVIPPAEGQADDEPGVPSLTPRQPPPKRMARKPAFRTPVFSRVQNEKGIDYGMNHKAETDSAPNIPLPVRSSLAQTIFVWKVQLSHYFRMVSGVTRFPGMAPGYPTAKTATLINTAPGMTRTTRGGMIVGATGRPARQGFMAAPPRFSKALPAPINDYQPPIYGE